MTMRALLVSCCLAATALAQHVVVPSAFESVDGPSRFGFAGVTVADHQQIVVDARHLTALQSQAITGIRLRRDQTFGAALAAGRFDLVVRIGNAPGEARRASASFAGNLPSPIEVFRGRIDLPPAPPVSGPLGWDAPDAVAIRFATPWPYTGGHLCLDLDGTPTSATRWPFDAASDPVQGSVTNLGVACSRFASAVGQTVVAMPRDLIVGQTARFVGRGEPGGSAFPLFGLQALPTPVDLAVVGAPGCALRIASFASGATSYGPIELGALFGGLANYRIAIPSDSALLGARFLTQWLETGPPLTSSNALDCRIAAALPTLGMATVSAAPGQPEGHVDVTQAPVVRFDLR
jgi:hypothetical protein